MRLLSSLILFLVVGALWAQESVFPMQTNRAYDGLEVQQNKTKTQGGLTLPFVDDFSYDGPYPNPILWADSYAFINNTYAIDPISIGVATLDGLGPNGLPHNENASASSSLSADTLTSQTINLDDLSPSDEVFISFYYQAQGYGFELGAGDSLLLQFKNDSSVWETVWFSEGISLDDFQLALVRLDSADYFHDSFQFRFRNYAALTGNNDQWHIDHIRLDDNRSVDDNILVDVAIVYEPSSILTNYTQMPWNQFYDYQSTELNSEHYITLRNNDNITINTGYEYIITELSTGDVLADQLEFTINFLPGLILDQQLIEPIDILTDYSSDTVEFLLDYTIYPSGDQYLGNNNVSVIQQFGNQLAYDDGSSELSYGLFGDGAQLAMEYALNEPDSLRAVGIFFTSIEFDQTDRFFSLIVWDDIDVDGFGLNAVELARMDLQTPEYQPGYNQYTYYVLPEPIAVDETFYIGMSKEGVDEIVLGYDKNNIADEHTYYNISGEWVQSTLNGAVMMRPILGGTLPSSVNVEEEIVFDNITVYPVPTQDLLYLEFSQNSAESVQIEILNLNGAVVYAETYEEQAISLADFTDGMYVMLIKNNEGEVLARKKILKN